MKKQDNIFPSKILMHDILRSFLIRYL